MGKKGLVRLRKCVSAFEGERGRERELKREGVRERERKANRLSELVYKEASLRKRKSERRGQGSFTAGYGSL